MQVETFFIRLYHYLKEYPERKLFFLRKYLFNKHLVCLNAEYTQASIYWFDQALHIGVIKLFTLHQKVFLKFLLKYRLVELQLRENYNKISL